MPELNFDDLVLDKDIADKYANNQMTQLGEAPVDTSGGVIRQPEMGFWERTGRQGLGELQGIQNLAVSSLGYIPAAMLAQTGAAFTGRDPEELAQKIMGYITPKPPAEGSPEAQGYNLVTKPAEAVMDVITKPAQIGGKLAEKAAEKLPEGWVDPKMLGYTVKTGLELVTVMKLYKVGEATTAKVKNKLTKADKLLQEGKPEEAAAEIDKFKNNLDIFKKEVNDNKVKATEVGKNLDQVIDLISKDPGKAISDGLVKNAVKNLDEIKEANKKDVGIIQERIKKKVIEVKKNSEKNPAKAAKIAESINEDLWRAKEITDAAIIKADKLGPAVDYMQTTISGKSPDGRIDFRERQRLMGQIKPIERKAPEIVGEQMETISQQVSPFADRTKRVEQPGVAEKANEEVRLQEFYRTGRSGGQLVESKDPMAAEVDKVIAENPPALRSIIEQRAKEEIEPRKLDAVAKADRAERAKVDPVEQANQLLDTFEMKLREAASGKDIDQIRERVDRLYEEAALVNDMAADLRRIEDAQRAMEMVEQTRERVVQAQRAKMIREMPAEGEKPKRTAQEIKQQAKEKRAVDVGYHGSAADMIDRFDLNKAGTATDYGFAGKGIYFSSDKALARVYAERQKGSVHKADITLENPLTDKTELRDIQTNTWKNKELTPNEGAEIIRNEILNRGYDGVKVDGEIVAFYPEQVNITKSAKVGKKAGVDKWKAAIERAKQRLADEGGSVDARTLSPETRLAVEELVATARRAGKKLEKFVEENGLSKEHLLIMRQVAKDLDRDKKLFEKAESPTGQIVKQTKSGKYVDEAGETRQLTRPTIEDYKLQALHRVNNIPARPVLGKIETAIRTFDRMGEDAKQLFYDPIKDAEGFEARENRQLAREAKAVKQKLSRKDIKDLGTWTLQNQRGGREALKNMDMTPLPAELWLYNPKAYEAYQWLRQKYDEFFERVNKARIAAGEKPMNKVENYATFINDIANLQLQGLAPFEESLKTMADQINQHKNRMTYKSAKHRAKMGLERKLETNPFIIFDTYSRGATKYIHKAPVVAELTELLGEFGRGDAKWDLSKSAKNSAGFLKEWRDHQAGKRINMPWLAKAINDNLVFSIMAYNVRSALIQPTAFINTFALIGTRGAAEGIGAVIKSAMRGDKSWETMMEKSNVMPARKFDVSVSSVMDAKGRTGKLRAAQKKVANVGMVPLASLDLVTAAATWMGAYKKGLRDFGESRKAARYADDVVTRTQGSAAISDISPIQRTALGKVASLFQTFTLNNWDFIVRDIMGYKNPQIKTPKRIARATRLVMGITLSNMFYRHVIGVNPPTPEPIHAFLTEMENSGNIARALFKSGLELTEVIPFLSGPARYGSSAAGPLVDTITKALAWEDNPVGAVTAMLKLVGTPALSQVKKIVRAANEGKNPIDIVTGGLYGEPTEVYGAASRGGRTRRSRRATRARR